jgi:hypothetical protein
LEFSEPAHGIIFNKLLAETVSNAKRCPGKFTLFYQLKFQVTSWNGTNFRPSLLYLEPVFRNFISDCQNLGKFVPGNLDEITRIDVNQLNSPDFIVSSFKVFLNICFYYCLDKTKFRLVFPLHFRSFGTVCDVFT